MKKLFSVTPLIAVSFLLYSGTVQASEFENNEGVLISEEEFDNLKEIGFSELQIQNMSQELFDDNRDKELVSETSSTKYIEMTYDTVGDSLATRQDFHNSPSQKELTADEYYERLNAPESFNTDTTSTAYRTLTTSIQTFTDDTRLRSEFEWDQMPVTRSMDVLSTSIDSTFSPVSGSGYGQQLYTGYNNNTGELLTQNQEYNSSNSNWIHQSQGYALKMNLFNDPGGANALEVSGYQYYEITTNSDVTPTLVNAYGNYAHADVEVNLNYSVDLSFGGPGLSFSLEESSNFSEMTTHAQMDY
ncbi:hypothetical protein MM326_11080 [Alkalihalobacillus sp. LMS6]|uniref:hypothetical protein n=1 Tax=Alkalihalobacillus sp. LMS6 TaxID=2924034 RepID=UPI0020D1D163|nr:hypothetical protein [Alkalihalobacillus sp. LMS6]UTR04684.1 hypothetical protein MM326_11080 [Alkalihalobacillus sp. LMS6]